MSAPPALRTGFAGLGAMGAHMARNLHHQGLLTAVWNRTTSKATAFAADTGCRALAGPAGLADMARQCDVVVLCVAADSDVLECIDQLLPGVHTGLVVVDCSTVAADTAREAARRLSTAGAEFLDAPVSGGVEGARDARLAIMVGGSRTAFEHTLPVLAARGATVRHLGPTGFGQATKATNQIMCAGIIQAVAEAMAFAKAEGLPLAEVIDTLGKGAGASWYFVNRAPNMVRDAYPAGFRVQLHAKDLRICQSMAARHGVQLPVVDTTLAHYAELIATGHGDDDISSLFVLKDALFRE